MKSAGHVTLMGDEKYLENFITEEMKGRERQKYLCVDLRTRKSGEMFGLDRNNCVALH